MHNFYNTVCVTEYDGKTSLLGKVGTAAKSLWTDVAAPALYRETEKIKSHVEVTITADTGYDSANQMTYIMHMIYLR
jgi:hypothetical protein